MSPDYTPKHAKPATWEAVAEASLLQDELRTPMSGILALADLITVVPSQ